VTKAKKKRPGHPVTTGAGLTKLVAWRPTLEERKRLEAEAAAEGITVNELSRRRTLARKPISG
jgi:hypothetical protein